MISANGGLPAHRYTPQVTPRWPRGSEPASVLAPDGAESDKDSSLSLASRTTGQTTTPSPRPFRPNIGL